LEVYGTAQGAHIVGLDFSWDALQLAAEIVPPSAWGLVRASALRLPFADGSFDLALAFDLVEHLYPHELDAMLAEAFRVLKPGGRMIVHTMPNIWYYRYAYPLYRWVQRLRGVNLPRDPRDRSRHVHVNIQSLTSLSASLRRAGFSARVRLRNTQDFATEASPAMRRAYRLLASVYPFKWIFCNDLFGVGTKP
jgi:ubiquinone/menaquinone biosynthesis C-methylase UbiE